MAVLRSAFVLTEIRRGRRRSVINSCTLEGTIIRRLVEWQTGQMAGTPSLYQVVCLLSAVRVTITSSKQVVGAREIAGFKTGQVGCRSGQVGC